MSSKPLVHLPLFDEQVLDSQGLTKFAGERATGEQVPYMASVTACEEQESKTAVGRSADIQQLPQSHRDRPMGIGCEPRAMTSPAIHATARSTDPETSHESAEAFTEQRLTEIQTAVFELFTVRRRLTDEEIEDALSVKYPAFSTLRKRRTDLVQMGLIRDSGERRFNRNRRRMIVWEIAK
jgi:hypothetical protein